MRLLLPLIKEKRLVGAKLLTYFPYLNSCSLEYNKSQIVQIGYYNFTRNENKSEYQNHCYCPALKLTMNHFFVYRIFHSNI